MRTARVLGRRAAVGLFAAVTLAACAPTQPPPAPPARVEPIAPKEAPDPMADQQLLRAAHDGDLAQVRAALAAGADIESRDEHQRTPLLLAALADHVNNLGWTALLEAVVLGDGSKPYQDIVRLLVDAGANVNTPDRNGVTALQHAERDGYPEIAAPLR